MASLLTAWRHGRRALECDVRGSRDGVPIVFHDATLERMTGTRGVVARLPWRTLQRLDAGRRFGAQFAGERIASVAQVLLSLRSRPVTLFLDVKVRGLERRLHRNICAAGMADRCRIISSYRSVLEGVRRLRPPLALYRVTSARQPITPRLIQEARRLRWAGFVVHTRWATPRAVRRIREAGLQVYVWTVRRHSQERRLAARGVTGVMTERCPR